MERPPDQHEFETGDGIEDLCETYCFYIFQSGKFDYNDVLKALLIFLRIKKLPDLEDGVMTNLKWQVRQAIEDRVQKSRKCFKISDEECVEHRVQLWQQFCSYCEQYRTKSIQPLGLFILAPIEVICLIKKKTFSLFRPCEILDQFMLFGNNIDEELVSVAHFKDNSYKSEDLIQLVKLIAIFEEWLPNRIKIEIKRNLYQLQLPENAIINVTSSILAENNVNEFIVDIYRSLREIKDFRSAMLLLIDMLRLDKDSGNVMYNLKDDIHCTRSFTSIGNMFGSILGQTVLSETLRQIASTRFAACRNLLILLKMLNETYLFSDRFNEASDIFIPDIVMLLQSYYVMVWISATPFRITSLSTLSTTIEQLNILQLAIIPGRINAAEQNFITLSLLRAFLNTSGLRTALTLFFQKYKHLNNRTWQETLIPLATTIWQLIWPISSNFAFGEWLLSTGQLVIIQKYVDLNQWCKSNSFSRQFISAVCYLESGEINKSTKLFQISDQGGLNETLFSEKILKDIETDILT